MLKLCKTFQKMPMSNFKRANFSTLVLAESFEGKISPSLGSVLTAAKQLDDSIDVLVHGSDCASQFEQVQQYPGINKVIVANNPALENAYGDSVARIAQSLVGAHGYTNVVAATTGFGKDVIPRLGGLLDVQPITDVIEVIDGGNKFKRPVYAGNLIATVSTIDSIKLVTVRPTNFEKIEPGEASGAA